MIAYTTEASEQAEHAAPDASLNPHSHYGNGDEHGSYPRIETWKNDISEMRTTNSRKA